MPQAFALAAALFPQTLKRPDEWEAFYPPRALPAGAAVTRFAPSPTGVLHIGGVFTAFANQLLAGQTGGSFFLRLEDTDDKRLHEDGVAAILQGLAAFGFAPTEGVTEQGDVGAYAPYTQSQRTEVYHSFAKHLVQAGLAYPCFCTEDALATMRDEQKQAGANPGYYGSWARCRDLPHEDRLRRIAAGERYTLRLRAPGDAARKIVVQDLVRGKLEFPENDLDETLLKANGVPTYHFAHAVDDHLMRVTHVIRGDEWLPSLPRHVQLFAMLGFRPPQYVHLSPILKQDAETGGKRKLSKRKDPEAAVSYFVEQGYPAVALREYLLTLLNSNFEDWRRANSDAPQDRFAFQIKKLSPSGALFDLQKLRSVSKNAIARLDAETMVAAMQTWAQAYSPVFAARLQACMADATRLLAIDRGGKRTRKDIACWSEAEAHLVCLFDDAMPAALQGAKAALPLPPQEACEWLQGYAAVLCVEDDHDAWFAKLRQVCEAQGCDVRAGSGVLRLGLTARLESPDLHAILRILGHERAQARLRLALQLWGE